jgi:hypothetical protein
MTATAPASVRRSITAWGPKPENIGNAMAPMLTTARNAAMASGTEGMNRPTTSPWRMPSDIRPPAARDTVAANSA